jgi:hypothetical protein
MSAITVTYKLLSPFSPTGSYWQFGQGVRNPAGQLIPAPNGAAIDGVPLGFLPASCATTVGRVLRPPASCRQVLAGFHGFITYQPASRYWAFQGIEFGIFAALAALLIGVTAVVLLRRDV